MKTLKDKKGFTLIELLAVIVILAIVTVIATRTVLPFLRNSGRDTFATEANDAILAASDAMSLITIGKLDRDTYKTSANTFCFTLADLAKEGVWTKEDPNYVGKIIVTVSDNNRAYEYAIQMHNKDYYVNSPSGQILAEDRSDSVPNGVGEATADIKEGLVLTCK